MGQIQRMQDFSELVPYDEHGIALYIGTGALSKDKEHDLLCHWHDEMEVTRILRGNMDFQVGEQVLCLREGDILVTNSRQMHGNRLESSAFCMYQCLLFHTNLLTENRLLVQRYIKPVQDNANFSYLYIAADALENAGLAKILDALFEAKETQAAGYELEVIAYLHLIWNRILPLCTAQVQRGLKEYTDESLLKNMVSYIYQHFMEHVSLADIAAAGNVCQNKCCSIFKRYMKQSPVDFLNAYRLQVSRNLLERTEQSVTEIALACGFNHLSYFSKMFQRKYGMTPSMCRHPE